MNKKTLSPLALVFAMLSLGGCAVRYLPPQQPPPGAYSSPPPGYYQQGHPPPAGYPPPAGHPPPAEYPPPAGYPPGPPSQAACIDPAERDLSARWDQAMPIASNTTIVGCLQQGDNADMFVLTAPPSNAGEVIHFSLVGTNDMAPSLEVLAANRAVLMRNTGNRSGELRAWAHLYLYPVLGAAEGARGAERGTRPRDAAQGRGVGQGVHQ